MPIELKVFQKAEIQKKDQVGTSQTTSKDSSSANFPAPADSDDIYERHQDNKVTDAGKKSIQRENISYNPTADFEKQPPPNSSNYSSKTWDDTSGPPEKEKIDARNTFSGSSNQNTEEMVQKVSPPRRKGYREEKSEKNVNWQKKDAGEDKSEKGSWSKREGNNSDVSSVGNNKQHGSSISNSSYMATKQSEPEQQPHDENINEILEEEEALIAAHRKEIEDTMEIVREEMKLLAEVDKPGSLIDNYVTQLSFVLSRKAASLVSLQARLARFQHRLKEQEILSRKRVPRS